MSLSAELQSRAYRLLRAAAHRFWPFARRRVEHRLADTERRLAALEQHLAAFLNAVSTVGAFGFEVQKLWDRVEFVRREILYEMKYGRDSRSPSRVEARILDADKVARALREGLRLNLGCGHVPLDGYVNVDQRDVPGADIVADLGDLPVEPGQVREIFSAHVLEHFPQEELRRRFLPYWRELIAPDGVLRAVVPDGEAMLANLANGNYPFEEFREVLFGAQEYDGDFHFNLLTPASLGALLEEAGFTEVRVPVRGRRNGKCYEFEIQARRP